jgi:peptide/nickel transport system substrate-binding protein
MDPARVRSLGELSVTHSVTEHLVIYDEQLTLRPRLAESWSMAPDKVTLTFNLRKGVKFHDGTPFDANVLRTNYERWRDAKRSPNTTDAESLIEDFTVVDANTVRVKSKGPKAQLMGFFTSNTGIISPDSIKSLDGGGTSVVGTGPFKVDQLVPNESMVLTKNADYWGDKANLDRLEFRNIPEATARTAALLGGQTDFAFALQTSQLQTLQGQPRIQIAQVESSLFNNVIMHMNRAPLDRLEVRKALRQAIDPEAVKRAAYFGLGAVHDTPLPPTVFQAQGLPAVKRADPAGARAELQRLGLADLKLKLLAVSADTRVPVAIQEQFRQVGVTIDFDYAPDFGSFIAKLYAGDYDLAAHSGGSLQGEPVTPLLRTVAPTPLPLFNNPLRASYPGVTELVPQLETELDEAKQKPIIEEMFRKFVDLSPWLYGINVVLLYAFNEKVKGFSSAPNGFIELRKLWVEP